MNGLHSGVRAVAPVLALLLCASTPAAGPPEPARAAEATPAGASVDEEVLVEATLALGQLPPDVGAVLMGYETVEAGLAPAYPATYVPPSVFVALVLEGTLVTRPAGTMLLTRAAPSAEKRLTERVAPGEEATLGPGDALLVPEVPVARLGSGALGEVRNPGPGRLVFLGAGVYHADPPHPPTGLSYRLLGSFTGAEWDAAVPPGPVTVRLARLR